MTEATVLDLNVSRPAGRPGVVLPGTEQRDMTACSNGRTYRIFVARPAGPAPSPAGYPVLFVLDGNAVFATIAEIVSLRSRRPEVTGVVPAIVVAIGYPTDEPLDLVRRTYDFTPPAERLVLGPRPDGTPWPPVGGADLFLDFLADELVPALARDFAVDRRRLALFGHSFGGLFALHALFTRPRLFARVTAASPSIWWNDTFILGEEEAFAAAVRRERIDARLLVTVGGLEQELTHPEIEGIDRALRKEWKARNRMVDNARELAARLTALAPHGFASQFINFAGEDHISVIPAALGRAVAFSLAKETPA